MCLCVRIFQFYKGSASFLDVRNRTAFHDFHAVPARENFPNFLKEISHDLGRAASSERRKTSTNLRTVTQSNYLIVIAED